MATISETYASPLLRWALLQEDFPGATHQFECVALDGIPEHIRPPERFVEADDEFCLATVRFPDDSGRPTAYAWSALRTGVRGQGNSTSPVKSLEQWNTLCTKTLGRALKRAGYPDDLTELKAAILWRRRNAEIAQLAGGSGVGSHMQIEAGATIEGALEASGRPSPDDVGLDDESGPPPGVDPDTGEVVARPAIEATATEAPRHAEGPSVTPETKKRHQEAVNTTGKIEGATDKLKAFAKEQGISWAKPTTEDDALALIAEAERIAEAPFEEPKS
jgi:hypothetical protein